MKCLKLSFTAIAAMMLLAPMAFAQATAAQPVAAEPPAPPAEIDLGKVAPDFTIETVDSAGATSKLRLSDLRGKVVVVAFYPSDRSSGCTFQLTKFRDEYSKLFGAETVVLPISVDSLATHASWSKEMKFPFVLGSDTDMSLAKQWGSWAPGRKYSTRTVFVIGKDGTIRYRNLRFPALNEGAYTELAAEITKAR